MSKAIYLNDGELAKAVPVPWAYIGYDEGSERVYDIPGVEFSVRLSDSQSTSATITRAAAYELASQLILALREPPRQQPGGEPEPDRTG